MPRVPRPLTKVTSSYPAASRSSTVPRKPTAPHSRARPCQARSLAISPPWEPERNGAHTVGRPVPLGQRHPTLSTKEKGGKEREREREGKGTRCMYSNFGDRVFRQKQHVASDDMATTSRVPPNIRRHCAVCSASSTARPPLSMAWAALSALNFYDASTVTPEKPLRSCWFSHGIDYLYSHRRPITLTSLALTGLALQKSCRDSILHLSHEDASETEFLFPRGDERIATYIAKWWDEDCRCPCCLAKAHHGCPSWHRSRKNSRGGSVLWQHHVCLPILEPISY